MSNKQPTTYSEADYTNKIIDSGVKRHMKRLLVGTPTMGVIRMEWAAARYGQVIPSNWSKVDMIQYMTSMIPMRYTVHDAQNIIVREAVEQGYEWLLLLEDDTIPPPDAFIRFNEYMRHGKYPVVSGLYFTRSVPPEPMVYRGRGNSYYTDWHLEDLVWVDGVPTGMLLISVKLLKAMYDESTEYVMGGQTVRRVFDNPVATWYNEETGAQETLVGTSDLDWCKRVINEGWLARAGWPELQKKEFPFLIDTNIFCRHIDRTTGTQYPVEFPEEFLPLDIQADRAKTESYKKKKNRRIQ